MKVKVFPDAGQTIEDAEFLLEKALKTKRKSTEDRYAKESYKNEHLDEFHDMITKAHEKVVKEAISEVVDLLKFKLKV